MVTPTPSPLQRMMDASRAGFRQLRHAGWAKPFRNIGVLLLGRGTQAVFSLVYVALAARTLGPQSFGILVLIHSMALAISDIARFQTWQAVLHYGAPALHHGKMGDLRRIIRFSLMLDTVGVAIGMLVVFFGAASAVALFDMPAEMETPIRLYGLTIIFIVFADTPNGLLRLLGRFDLMAWQSTVMPAIRLVGSIILWIIQADIYGFLILWFSAAVLEHLVLFILATKECIRRGLLSRSAEEEEPSTWRADKSVWRFCIFTSLDGSLQLAQSHLGTLAVGWLLGPAPAGLFRIATQVASVLVKPLRQLFMPSILPELSHLKAADRQKDRRVMVQRVSILTGLAATGLLLVLAVVGKPLINLMAGGDFVEAYGVMLVLAGAGTISAWAVALEPLLISDGRVQFITTVRIAGTALYLAALYPLTNHFGLIGAGYAAMIQTAILSLIFLSRVAFFPNR